MKMTMSGPTEGRGGAQTMADELIEESTKRGINPQTLGVDLSLVMGLSDWFTGTPPEVGWWNVRFKNVVPLVSVPQRRRWWNGTNWSWPVTPGVDDDEYCAKMQQTKRVETVGNPEPFEYQGLRRPWQECRYAN